VLGVAAEFNSSLAGAEGAAEEVLGTESLYCSSGLGNAWQHCGISTLGLPCIAGVSMSRKMSLIDISLLPLSWMHPRKPWAIIPTTRPEQCLSCACLSCPDSPNKSSLLKFFTTLTGKPRLVNAPSSADRSFSAPTSRPR